MKNTKICIFLFVLILSANLAVFAQSEDTKWRPVPGKIMTRWAADVSPDNVWPEYPRPGMVREQWLNLNGLWDFAIVDRDFKGPFSPDGEILVPFPIESNLSGVGKMVGPAKRLVYRKTFAIPSEWGDKDVIIHFGAVDWEAEIILNGKLAGVHSGGYDPFSFDISEFIAAGGEQELIVRVWDPSSAGDQPCGKQVLEPRGIWYTPTTGIWRTVWLEPVGKTRIDVLRITPDVDGSKVGIELKLTGAAEGMSVAAEALAGGKTVGTAVSPAAESVEFAIDVLGTRLWSPDSPFLYDLKITLASDDGLILDAVGSYFGMRKIALGKDENGLVRLFLNNEPLFQLGPLDQGFWPDGLYTPATSDAYKHDIEVTKKLGFNMLRKHVKVEADLFYYWCDKLGILVWQDMPNGDDHIGRGDDLVRRAQSARQFETELRRMIDSLYNHPCIVMWVPFNEGWGQYDTQRIADWIKELDSTRLVNNASGWADRGAGDVADGHSYPGPAANPCEPDRASVLGEFGGLGLPVEGHTWQDKENWGYKSFESAEDLTAAYEGLLEKLPILIAGGLSAAVYTQTSDVEIEVNGLMTYDRALVKMDVERVAAANRYTYTTKLDLRPVVPTAREQEVEWKYNFDNPGEGWMAVDFDDSAWQTGVGGFGSEGTPGAVIGTAWDGEHIWIRRTFELDSVEFEDLRLSISHDDEAEVYINGVPAIEAGGWTKGYVPERILDEALATLKVGTNTIAIYCHQRSGGQFIDAGLVDVRVVK